MARIIFYYISAISLVLVATIYPFWEPIIYALLLIVPYIAIGIHDINSKQHNILRNYPVIGHLRYMLEHIRPHIQQYFIATNQSERPYSREVRNLIYRRAKNVRNTLPFGTQQDITSEGYLFSYHSLSPKKIAEEHMRVTIGGKHCQKPYNASRLNISALSFGAISSNAVRALNRGAKYGKFAHNTGEGGISRYHLEEGGDIILQFGTGYFGCRDEEGNFSREIFREKSNIEAVKMVEIKLSQGAKPSHGGLLPAVKVDEEVAKMRCVEVGKDSISPPHHSAFSTPRELLEFVAELRELSGGKPVGFKLCIGIKSEFMGICKAMLETGITPDFITVDGAEGGTGAAPVEFSNRLGMPIDEAIIFVNNCLIGIGLRDEIKIIASGKVATGYDMVTKIALGADICNAARAMMFALGCLQSLSCNTNKCPTGIATQDKRRIKALDVDDKSIRVANFHRATVAAFGQLVGAMGVDSPDKLSPDRIYRYSESGKAVSFAADFPQLKTGDLLTDNIHPEYKTDWQKASADRF